MFFKKLKNKLILLLISLLIIPINVMAYSDYIIASGENVGIELNASGIFVVGTYEIGNVNPAKDANLQSGDKIISVNDINITTIEEMLKAINTSSEKNNIKIKYLRRGNELNTILSLIKDNEGTYKTGLYVKDSINGVGTLTYIDPNTLIYGALGHEIIEKTSGQKLEIKDGKIFEASVTGIIKSNINNPGEKNAKYNSNNIYGNVKENTTSGIFGTFTKELNTRNNLYKVAQINDIILGEAHILTVIEGNYVEKFNINIIKLFENSNNSKNILFEITDPVLLEKSGGIVQGMSGSPIIQNNYIIGAVTHVVVSEPSKGYGIFITNMLEEGEN